MDIISLFIHVIRAAVVKHSIRPTLLNVGNFWIKSFDSEAKHDLLEVKLTDADRNMTLKYVT